MTPGGRPLDERPCAGHGLTGLARPAGGGTGLPGVADRIGAAGGTAVTVLLPL